MAQNILSKFTERKLELEKELEKVTNTLSFHSKKVSETQILKIELNATLREVIKIIEEIKKN